MADELDQAIRDNASGPAEVHGDAGSVKQHPIAEQIEADRYLQSKQATRRKGFAIRLKKLVPPGTD